MLKKISIIILIFIQFIFYKVSATTFYTETLKEKNINSEYPLEEIIKYRFYQEEKVGEYLTPKDKSNYSYIDYENKKYGEYGPYLDECNDTNKDVLNTYLYPYKTLKGINYVKVYNLSRKININKVKIFDQNLESEYQIIETHQYINNYLDTGGYILIKLNSQIPYTNFNITISSTDYSKIISYKLFNTIENHLIDKTVLTNSQNNTLSLDNIPSSHYSDLSYSEKPVSKTSDNIIYEKIPKCRMRDIYYYHYNIKKNYLKGYYENIEGYIKDNNDYQIYYRYILDDTKISFLKKELELSIEKLNNCKNNEVKNEVTCPSNISKEKDYKYIKELTPVIQNITHKNFNDNSLKKIKLSLIITIISLLLLLLIYLFSKKSRTNK